MESFTMDNRPMRQVGFNSLSIPGPTNMPFQVRAAMDVALEDHRSPAFPQFLLPLLEDLKKVYRTKTGKALVFAGSGTGGWDAALTNTLSPGDKVLIPVYGQFSALWAQACKKLKLDTEVMEVEWGLGAPADRIGERLAADKAHAIKAVLVCHNETATGVTSDLAAVRKAIDAAKHPALFMIDGVSSIASIDFRMDDWGVDVAVAGSQKGFMLPAGLAILAVSEKAIAVMEKADCARSFYDIRDVLKMNAAGYFPYTPATTLLRGLRASLDMLLEEGMDSIYARHRRIAEGARAAIKAWGLPLCAKEPRWYSDTVSTIMVPQGIDANEVNRIAYERYNLSLALGLGPLNGRAYRIGHMGWTNELMVIQSIAGSEMAMADAGIKIELGSGVAAAQKVYRQSAA
jgi:alanine-glyoxylate transaminase/serine-glyoxylate transaminase/serine-pyruvate transaminase